MAEPLWCPTAGCVPINIRCGFQSPMTGRLSRGRRGTWGEAAAPRSLEWNVARLRSSLGPLVETNHQAASATRALWMKRTRNSWIEQGKPLNAWTGVPQGDRTRQCAAFQ